MSKIKNFFRKMCKLSTAEARIKLESNDGSVFRVSVKVAELSTVLKTMFDLNISEPNEKNVIIPLSQINSQILSKIVEWIMHYRDDPPIFDSSDNSKKIDTINEWDAKFLDLPLETLISLAEGANFLEIKYLYEITCKTIADKIRHKIRTEQLEKLIAENNVSNADDEETESNKEEPAVEH